MKITKISIHNFLKLKDVEMNPSQTNVIVGKNKMGKTSVLKAIRAAFTGDADNTSIRIGENTAEITIDTEELTIKRTFNAKGTKLDVSNKEGLKYPAPQKYLDGILGTFSFNPIEFFEKKAIDRKKYLLDSIKLTITQDELAAYTGEKLAGLDYDAHALEVVEMARKYYYDKRTGANAEVSKKEKSLLDLTSKIPAGFDPKNVSEEQITALREAIQKDEKTEVLVKANQEAISRMQSDEVSLKNQIADLTARLILLQDEIIAKSEMKFDVSDPMAIAAAKDTLASLEGQREVVFTAKRADEVRGELTSAMAEAEKLDVVVKKLTKEVPQDLIAKAKLPIDGLTIDGNDIFIGGVNIDNMSSSEQLKFGLQIVRALNGEFKVVCVDGVESLDKESFAFFLREAANDDYQYFVTRVDGESEHSIVIEDGEIKI